jgi:cytochrome c oxidase assembly factor CtaG
VEDTAPPRDARSAWLAALGAALIVVSLVPPVVTAAHRYVFAESVQFVTFSLAAPALIVLGAPWRLLRLPVGRLAARRRRDTSFLHTAGYLLAFIGVCLVWRLPPVMDALARRPALVAAELLTLLAVGTGLWLELVSSPPVRPRLPRPQRAAAAALAMWSTWIVAYALGLSNGTVFHAYDPPGGVLSAAADQEISAALVWAVAGLCFVPIVFVAMLGWLGRDDTDEELQRIVRDHGQRLVVRGWKRPRGRPGHGDGPGGAAWGARSGVR